MKRIKSKNYILLTFISVIVVTLTMSARVFAAGSATFSLDSGSIELGSNLNLSLSVSTSGESIQNGDLELNFPSNVSFESYTPSSSVFDAYNANIFNSPSGSSTVTLSFVSSGPETSGLIGTIQVSGSSVGSGEITITNAAANDGTVDAGPMTVSVSNANITVEEQQPSPSQQQQQSQEPVEPTTTTAIVPEPVESDVTPSASPQNTNSTLVDPAENSEEPEPIVLDEEIELSGEDDVEFSNTVLETETSDSDDDLFLWIIIGAIGTGLLIIGGSFLYNKRLKSNKNNVVFVSPEDNRQAAAVLIKKNIDTQSPGSITTPTEE